MSFSSWVALESAPRAPGTGGNFTECFLSGTTEGGPLPLEGVLLVEEELLHDDLCALCRLWNLSLERGTGCREGLMWPRGQEGRLPRGISGR